MGYDWEQIFRNTSSQELYKIYRGQTIKPKEAIQYAKKELDRRGFDFSNMEQNKKDWELLNTMEEEAVNRLNFSNRMTEYISFKKYMIILIVVLILFFSYAWIKDGNFECFTIVIPIVIGFFGIYTVINNLIYKKRHS